jgi:hypothetical protein
MTKDEALRLALEALENPWKAGPDGVANAIIAIKAALEAKDEPEYYGLTKDHLWMSISKEHYDRLKPEFRMACYATPPQRTWVGLTDEEIRKWWASENGLEDCDMCKIDDFILVARAIEAKLKEKNG